MESWVDSTVDMNRLRREGRCTRFIVDSLQFEPHAMKEIFMHGHIHVKMDHIRDLHL